MFSKKWQVGVKFIDEDTGNVVDKIVKGPYRTKTVANWHFDICDQVAKGPEMALATIVMAQDGGPKLTFVPYIEDVTKRD